MEEKKKKERRKQEAKWCGAVRKPYNKLIFSRKNVERTVIAGVFWNDRGSICVKTGTKYRKCSVKWYLQFCQLSRTILTLSRKFSSFSFLPL